MQLEGTNYGHLYDAIANYVYIFIFIQTTKLKASLRKSIQCDVGCNGLLYWITLTLVSGIWISVMHVGWWVRVFVNCIVFD